MESERNKEVRKRIDAWESEHQKKLKELNEEEWIEAMQGILCLTKMEAKEYLDYLQRDKY